MAVKCPACKAAVEKPLVMHDQHGPYLRCPTCLTTLRLRPRPQPPEPRNRPHGSKKERRRMRATHKDESPRMGAPT